MIIDKEGKLVFNAIEKKIWKVVANYKKPGKPIAFTKILAETGLGYQTTKDSIEVLETTTFTKICDMLK